MTLSESRRKRRDQLPDEFSIEFRHFDHWGAFYCVFVVENLSKKWSFKIRQAYYFSCKTQQWKWREGRTGNFHNQVHTSVLTFVQLWQPDQPIQVNSTEVRVELVDNIVSWRAWSWRMRWEISGVPAGMTRTLGITVASLVCQRGSWQGLENETFCLFATRIFFAADYLFREQLWELRFWAPPPPPPPGRRIMWLTRGDEAGRRSFAVLFQRWILWSLEVEILAQGSLWFWLILAFDRVLHLTRFRHHNFEISSLWRVLISWETSFPRVSGLRTRLEGPDRLPFWIARCDFRDYYIIISDMMKIQLRWHSLKTGLWSR